jgi:hypothetical protein
LAFFYREGGGNFEGGLRREGVMVNRAFWGETYILCVFEPSGLTKHRSASSLLTDPAAKVRGRLLLAATARKFIKHE